MATNIEALNILQAKQLLIQAIESFSIELYFSPSSVNPDSDNWSEVLAAWQNFKGVVDTIVEVPTPEPLPEP